MISKVFIFIMVFLLIMCILFKIADFKWGEEYLFQKRSRVKKLYCVSLSISLLVSVLYLIILEQIIL